MPSSHATTADPAAGGLGWPGRAAAAALLLAASLLATAPLLIQPNLPRGDDVGEHVQFVQDFAAGLREGRLYPRWLAHSNRGFGAPAFLFYPPLATALVSLLHVAGLTLFGAFRAGFLALTLAGAAAGAWLGGRLAACPRDGLLSGALTGSLLVLLPYHAVDIYDRFALAETATFALVPLLLLGLEWEGRRQLVLVAGAFAGLCLAHLPTAYLAGLMSLGWVLSRGRHRLPAVAGALGLGAVCAAVYILPAVAERRHVHADWLEANPAYRYEAHFLLAPRPLDVDDPIHGKIQGRLSSPTLERVRWVAPLTLLLALAAWGVRRLRRAAGDPLPDPMDRYALLALLGTLGMTRLSEPLWRWLPGLASVVFPWRLTLLVSVAAAVLAGVTAAGLLRAPSRAGRGAGAALLAAVTAVALLASWPSVARADWQTFTPEYADRDLVRLRLAGAFMPRSNPRMRGFGAHPPARPPRLVTPQGGPGGDVRVDVEENHGLELTVQVEAPGGALLQVDRFDYPGWRARVNGQVVPHQRTQPLGTLELALPPGRHQVHWTFGPTPLRWAAALLSALGLAGLGVLTLSGTVRTMGRGRTA